MGRVLLEVADGRPGDGELDRLEHAGDVVLVLARTDQQVDVLWHEDIGPDLELLPSSGPVESLEEPQASSVSAQ